MLLDDRSETALLTAPDQLVPVTAVVGGVFCRRKVW